MYGTKTDPVVYIYEPIVLVGCTYVLHTASPFPIDAPKDPEKELYEPAVNGTLNVMKVIMTKILPASYNFNHR